MITKKPIILAFCAVLSFLLLGNGVVLHFCVENERGAESISMANELVVHTRTLSIRSTKKHKTHLKINQEAFFSPISNYLVDTLKPIQVPIYTRRYLWVMQLLI